MQPRSSVLNSSSLPPGAVLREIGRRCARGPTLSCSCLCRCLITDPPTLRRPTQGVAIYKSENWTQKLANIGASSQVIFHSGMERTGGLCYASKIRDLGE